MTVPARTMNDSEEGLFVELSKHSGGRGSGMLQGVSGTDRANPPTNSIDIPIYYFRVAGNICRYILKISN